MEYLDKEIDKHKIGCSLLKIVWKFEKREIGKSNPIIGLRNDIL